MARAPQLEALGAQLFGNLLGSLGVPGLQSFGDAAQAQRIERERMNMLAEISRQLTKEEQKIADRAPGLDFGQPISPGIQSALQSQALPRPGGPPTPVGDLSVRETRGLPSAFTQRLPGPQQEAIQGIQREPPARLPLGLPRSAAIASFLTGKPSAFETALVESPGAIAQRVLTEQITSQRSELFPLQIEKANLGIKEALQGLQIGKENLSLGRLQRSVLNLKLGMTSMKFDQAKEINRLVPRYLRTSEKLAKLRVKEGRVSKDRLDKARIKLEAELQAIKDEIQVRSGDMMSDAQEVAAVHQTINSLLSAISSLKGSGTGLSMAQQRQIEALEEELKGMLELSGQLAGRSLQLPTKIEALAAGFASDLPDKETGSLLEYNFDF